MSREKYARTGYDAMEVLAKELGKIGISYDVFSGWFSFTETLDDSKLNNRGKIKIGGRVVELPSLNELVKRFSLMAKNVAGADSGHIEVYENLGKDSSEHNAVYKVNPAMIYCGLVAVLKESVKKNARNINKELEERLERDLDGLTVDAKLVDVLGKHNRSFINGTHMSANSFVKGVVEQFQQKERQQQQRTEEKERDDQFAKQQQRKELQEKLLKKQEQLAKMQGVELHTRESRIETLNRFQTTELRQKLQLLESGIKEERKRAEKKAAHNALKRLTPGVNPENPGSSLLKGDKSISYLSKAALDNRDKEFMRRQRSSDSGDSSPLDSVSVTAEVEGHTYDTNPLMRLTAASRGRGRGRGKH